MTSLKNRHRLLVIDDETNMRHMLATLMGRLGWTVETAGDGAEALKIIDGAVNDGEPFRFILCDIRMPVMDGMAFLKAARGKVDESTVIMMSAYGTLDTAVEAMKLGAYDYISKPFKGEEIRMVLEKAMEREKLQNENRSLKRRLGSMEENYELGSIIAGSFGMKDVLTLAAKASLYDTTVLVTGESGTGKELVAKGIHLEGSRRDNTFVPVNCGGIPETLVESEFFGYKKGAFTGAAKDRKGLFEEADGGTIFLDEIGELPVSMQVKLLRVLQESEVRVVGGVKPFKVDVRVIAATSRNLEEDVAKGDFRRDLYYRLNVITLKLPPLRERGDDILALSDHFLKKCNKKMGRKIEGISPSAMALLLKYPWPGNVRELENIIERAVVLADESILMPENFPEEIRLGGGGVPPERRSWNECFSMKQAKQSLEKQMIARALEETGGNRTKAGQLLEISHPSLLSKMKLYGIK